MRHLVLFACVVGGLSLSACKMQFGVGYNQGYSPEQPLPFDHSIHAGQNKIACQYCHNEVERSPHSTIPALSTCMNCHLLVKTDSPYIQKLAETYNNGDTIKWMKVHLLPDFVKFNHSAHIKKGFACQTCHRPVETMKQVSQDSDVSMGWCVNCHREPGNNAPLNCSTCHN